MKPAKWITAHGHPLQRRKKESTFTAPRTDCPRPDWWHSTDSESTELEVTALVAAMVTALQPDFVIETGTCVGNTAYAIGKALRAYGHGMLVSLETDAGSVSIARRKCANLPVTILPISSLDYVPEQPVDFAFFDSLPKLRPAEFERYYPFMHSRTVVGFHDTAPHHTVRTLLLPLEERGLIVSPLFLPTPRGVMFSRIGSS
jgi:predicted O-methyltransferase YrrM